MNRSAWREPVNSSHKRELNTKLHMAVAKNGRQVRVITTECSESDCKRALEFVVRLNPRYFLADKAYDANEILRFLESQKIKAAIHPTANRKIQQRYYKEIYKKWHCIENIFLLLEEWLAISIRYAKNIRSFVDAFFCRIAFDRLC